MYITARDNVIQIMKIFLDYEKNEWLGQNLCLVTIKCSMLSSALHSEPYIFSFAPLQYCKYMASQIEVISVT